MSISADSHVHIFASVPTPGISSAAQLDNVATQLMAGSAMVFQPTLSGSSFKELSRSFAQTRTSLTQAAAPDSGTRAQPHFNILSMTWPRHGLQLEAD